MEGKTFEKCFDSWKLAAFNFSDTLSGYVRVAKKLNGIQFTHFFQQFDLDVTLLTKLRLSDQKMIVRTPVALRGVIPVELRGRPP
jgi:hypothetical protein